MKYKKVLLLILDGFGINENKHGNAIAAAHKPNYDKFLAQNPHNQLSACGEDVGLPAGDMGNSEVGHLNIGAGRIIPQLNLRIGKSIQNGSFYQNTVLIHAIDHAIENNSNLHLLGLLSNGDVHSNINHFWHILEMAKRKGLDRVFLHAFLDGRDTLPHSGRDFLATAEDKMKEIGVGKIATISGRYYSMDRDHNWDRTQKAYDALIHGRGNHYNSSSEAIEASYKQNISDEFMLPSVILENGEPVAKIADNDGIMFLNFRADRARKLTRSFIFNDFDIFPTKILRNIDVVTLSEYDIEFTNKVGVAFTPEHYPDTLAEVISKLGLKQLHLAESEKSAHVTFFFNGGVEEPFKGEKRVVIPSPKVKTYDLMPEMSAFEVKDRLVEALNQAEYQFIVTNFANPDMVGHTGFFDAAVKAVEVVDKCLGDIIPAAKENDYNIILIADHGNADEMLDDNDNILTQHSKNPVPVIISLMDNDDFHVKSGRLADVAPTILSIMGIPIPKAMTGDILIT